MNPTKSKIQKVLDKSEMQKAFELHYLQQMKELKKVEKQHTLDALDFYICEALSECDYVRNILKVSEINIDKVSELYECLSFVINSIKSATKKLKKMQELVNADEF